MNACLNYNKSLENLQVRQMHSLCGKAEPMSEIHGTGGYTEAKNRQQLVGQA